jgi:hypothetical protein
MRCWPTCFAILLAAGLFSGCKQRQNPKPPSPQIIYAGLGVSNYLELGMTSAEIAKRNPDAEFRRVFGPDTWFWEKPFKKHRTMEIQVPARGAFSSPSHDRQPITWLSFQAIRLPPSILRVGSNEVLFHTNNVLRQETIHAFGEPEHHHDFSNPALLTSLRNRGESVSLSDSKFEHLYYPRHGAAFFLDGGVVTSFTIVKKFDGTNTRAKP